MIQHNFGCGIEGLKTLSDKSVDVVLTDPPYLYLKNQPLDQAFDEVGLFDQCKRVIKDDGFIVLFGRGTSFYRWNTMLAERGFVFKEEVVWDKCRTTSPVTPIGRKHETISIHSKKGSIIKTRVPFLQKYKHEPQKIRETINRIATTFGNRETFKMLKEYYETGKKVYEETSGVHFVTRSKDSSKNVNRTIVFAAGLEEGIVEQSIIKEEEDIIEIPADHYETIHETQKPVKLLIRLINLIAEPQSGALIVDPFAGSCSCAEAAHIQGHSWIGWENREDAYNDGLKRINMFKHTLFS